MHSSNKCKKTNHTNDIGCFKKLKFVKVSFNPVKYIHSLGNLGQLAQNKNQQWRTSYQQLLLTD